MQMLAAVVFIYLNFTCYYLFWNSQNKNNHQHSSIVGNNTEEQEVWLLFA